jgi:hypothetical protein
MTFDERTRVAKPYITGFVLGLIAAPIIAFGAGWVSTSGARADAVEMARVDTLAGVCSDSAGRIVTAEGADLGSYKGYDNRAKREELVTAAMANLLVPDDITKKVANVCNRALG